MLELNKTRLFSSDEETYKLKISQEGNYDPNIVIGLYETEKQLNRNLDAKNKRLENELSYIKKNLKKRE